MARTYKKFPWALNTYHRAPKGKQRALRGNARKGAIPPDEWDDKNFDKQCWLPQTVSDRLLDKGWDPYAVIHHLVHRYRVTQRVAREVVEIGMCGRRSWPAGVVVVYKEERSKYEDSIGSRGHSYQRAWGDGLDGGA